MINRQPIYQQLNQLLKDKIQQGGFSVGDKFLTEREICQAYQVSRATANKAISNLVSEGILEFRKGVGTFLKSRIWQQPEEWIVGFTENVKHAGKTPSTRVLKLEQLPASEVEPEVRSILGIGDDEVLYKIERLRLADDIPMILENRYLVARYCPDLSEESLRGSLYDLLLNQYKLHIVGSDETIQTTIIGDRESALLGIDKGLAGFRVISVGYVEGDIPLWWERTIHRPDGIEFRCRVRPHSQERRLRERLLL